MLDIAGLVRAVFQNKYFGIIRFRDERKPEHRHGDHLEPEKYFSDPRGPCRLFKTHKRELFFAPVSEDGEREAELVIQVSARCPDIPLAVQDRFNRGFCRSFADASRYADNARTIFPYGELGELSKYPAQVFYEHWFHSASGGSE